MRPGLNDIRNWIAAAAPGGGLVSDSRRVQSGDVFFAYPGDAQDGRRFIGAAADAGDEAPSTQRGPAQPRASTRMPPPVANNRRRAPGGGGATASVTAACA